MLNEALAPALLPAGLRVYAVGDVHGCDGRLAALHAAIEADLAARPVRRAAGGSAGQAVLVHLGDYVDRGEDSAGVVERLLQPPPRGIDAMVNLRGNHEAMMLAALQAKPGRSDALPLWLANGGDATLLSYGTGPEAGWSAARAAIPADHRDFLRNCALQWRAGGYLFVHAGIRPELPLEAQTEEDLLWIRAPFLDWAGPLPAVVVHGHTPAPEPVLRANRIGIDTGAVFGGPLTALVLEADRLGLLQA